MIHEETKSILLKVDDPFALRAMIPKSKTLPLDDFNFAAKHTLRATKLLRNMGYDVPSPIRYQYNWPGKFKPFDHQVEMCEFWTFNKRGFNLSDPGTAKTNAALWASDFLMAQGEIDRVLICAPLSTLETVWLQDIFDTLMHRNAVVVHGSRERRKKALATDSDYFIINHDGIKIKEIARIINSRTDINLIIVDEGDEFRNSQSEKYKALAAMIRPDCRLWWQTGTPIPNGPPDAWAQARLINPGGVPKFFGSFRRETMLQITPFKWVPKQGSLERAFDAMQPAIRFKKADCLDLPPVITTRRQALLTPEQRRAFKDMKEEMYLDSVRHQLAGEAITAVHAADQVSKLRQILCIAQGTPVLTARGWVAIETVTPRDRVWDGVEWVSQGGAVDKGVQRVILSDGVWLTPDHEVLYDQSSDQFARAAVRLPHRYCAARYDIGTLEESNMAVSLHMRLCGYSGKPEPAVNSPSERQSLWVSAQQATAQARYEQSAPISHLDAHQAPVHGPDVQGLPQLGWSWDNCMPRVGQFIRGVLARHAGRVCREPDNRQDRQQRTIHQRQLSMGDTAAASRQSQVYDLTNCGPRNRFVVRGDHGELLIVHNCGVIKDPHDDHSYVELPHQPRVDTLLECIAHASAKVIVIVPFKGIIKSLAKEVAKQYSVDVLNGDVTPTRRKEVVYRFKHEPDPHVLMCHPKVMSHGLNLTEADTTIFYAPIYSNAQFQQVIERFNRAGQTRKMTIVRIAASPMEWDIYDKTDVATRSQADMLDLYRKILATT